MYEYKMLLVLYFQLSLSQMCLLSSGFSHLPVPKGQVYKLEATAYVLLALVRAKVTTTPPQKVLTKIYSTVVFHITTREGQRRMKLQLLSPLS